MKSEGFCVDVNPDVLDWARRTAGLDRSDVARHCKATENEVAAWESGEQQPTWRTLSLLANLYKRPIAALLLLKPAKERPSPADFRRGTDTKRGLSPATHWPSEPQMARRCSRRVAGRAR